MKSLRRNKPKAVTVAETIHQENEVRKAKCSILPHPMLEVPDVDDVIKVHHDTFSIKNNYNDLMEESIETQDYGIRKQGHRSGRHTSSLCSTIRTLHTDNFITDTDANHSTIVNRLLSCIELF